MTVSVLNPSPPTGSPLADSDTSATRALGVLDPVSPLSGQPLDVAPDLTLRQGVDLGALREATVLVPAVEIKARVVDVQSKLGRLARRLLRAAAVAVRMAREEVVGGTRWLLGGDRDTPLLRRYRARGRHRAQSAWYGRANSTSERVALTRRAAREPQPEGNLPGPPPEWASHVTRLITFMRECDDAIKFPRDGYQFRC